MRLYKELQQQQREAAPAANQGYREKREQGHKQRSHKLLPFGGCLDESNWRCSKKESSADALMEVRSYLEEPCRRPADPLSWWERARPQGLYILER
ncbi:hypothetical protein AAFF_G00144200 [Aldrovandia affinis]|uniref:Uncharacterized protein n=1 Tax=Aldrovandia affinis TaxID=143900 RepID=A0AAD7WX33_9TELE|nr:hypothetical protein AAFF_G00144200 [Aldrovandia affinis]